MKKSGKLACHVVNSNIAIGSLPKLQTSHGLLALFEMIYYREPIFTVFSTSGRIYNTVVSIKCMMYKVSEPDTIALLGRETIDRNRVRGAVLCLSQDGACSNLCENFRENSLKRDLSNDTTVIPPLFSLVNTFNLVKYL
jgi:hypothetical protein